MFGEDYEEEAPMPTVPPGTTLTVTLDAPLIGVLLGQVSADVHRQVAAEVKEAVDSAIAGALGEQIRALTLDALRPAVEAAMAEGWRRTNQWGDTVGSDRITLKERVSEILDQRDGYNGGKRRVDEIAKETIDKALREDFKAILDEARASFKAQVDGVLQAKLRESLASSLGLKA